MPPLTVVTRFAPSPTGALHLGHAHAALFAWRAAQAHHGDFLVRIEDIDRQRCRADLETALLEDLAWLGLSWRHPVRRQSEHLDDYRAALTRLKSLGVVYPCFCSRRDIAAADHAPHTGEDGAGDGPVYPGTCRGLSAELRAERLAADLRHAWRLDVTRALTLTGPLDWHDREAGRIPAAPEHLGDVVLARRDTPTSYHLSVTVDDAMQGVTLVTRGVDLFQASHIHRLLQALLDLPRPTYHHHRLLIGIDGRRLAKRDGAQALAVLRAAGRSAAEVRALAGFPDGAGVNSANILALEK